MVARLGKALGRFADARSVEGRIVSVILVITLALMAWDVNALQSALADEQAAVSTQAADDDAAEKAAAEKVAKEKAEREAAEKAAKEKAEREAAEKAEREAAEKAAREQAEREAAQQQSQQAEPAPAAAPEDAGDFAADEGAVGEPDTSDATAELEPAAAPDTPAAPDEPAAAQPAASNPDDAYPAVVLYGKAAGITVKIAAPAGALPQGVQLRVRDVAGEALADQVEQATNREIADYRALDITLVDKNSREVQPKKPVNVTFVGAGLEAGDISVYHVDGGSVDRVATQQADSDTQSFEARSFSIYLVASVPVVEDAGERYTVTFVVEGPDGDTSVVDQLFDVEAGQAVGTLPEAPFRAGHHFTQWVDRATGTSVTASTVVEGDMTAVAQFDEVKVFQVTVEHWYTNPSTGEDTVFNKTIVEMERADAPLTVDSPVSTTVETEDGVTQPTYIPTQASVEITLDDLERATVEDGKGYLVKRVEYVPYDTTFHYVYLLENLDGEGYAEVARTDAQGVRGASVTAPRRDVEGGVFDHAETATITEEGQEVAAYYSRAQYKVTFDVNGGSYVDAQMAAYGSTVPLPTPTRTGYAFAGWYKDAKLQHVVEGDGITANAPTTLYAKWEPGQASYTVVYLKEKYDSATDTTSYVYDSTATAKAQVGSTVKATGAKALSGTAGYEADTARNAESSVKVAADGSSILRVYYKLVRYTLVFKHRTGSGRNAYGNATLTMGGTTYTNKQYQVADVVLGQDISALWPTEVASGKAGYAFTGWQYTTSSGSTTTRVTKVIELTPELVARATSAHVATFNAAYSNSATQKAVEYWLQQPDGTYAKSDTYSQGYASTGTLGAKEIGGYTYRSATPAGYAGTSGNTSRFYYDRNSYGIDYYYGGAKVRSVSDVFFEADISVAEYDFTPQQPAGMQDATWGGWYADSTLETPYAFGAMPGNNLVLYANWAMPDRTITFVDEASGTGAQTATYAHGARAEALQPAKRAGFTFQGWYADASLTRLYDFDKPLTADTTVYAKWAQDVLSYTVRYVSAEDESVEVLPSKTVSGPALQLGAAVTEKAAVVAGMLPDAGARTIELALSGNSVTFRYTAKRNVITYDVRYVLASDESVQVAPAKEGVRVSGDIVSVKEAAAAVDYALLESQGVEAADLHPESEVIDHTFSLGDNTITFRYQPYTSTSFTVNYLDMDGQPIPGVAAQQANVKVGGGYTVATGLAGYTLDHVEKDGVDQGKRSYYVAQDGAVSTIDVYYRTQLSVVARNLSKVYDGQPLASSGVGDVEVYGLRAGHQLAGIAFTGSQTQAGSSATTPRNARITGPANAAYYDITYVAGNLSVTSPAVTVCIAGDVVQATYDGQPHVAGYEVTSISNPDFKEEYIQFSGASESVELVHAGTADLALQGAFGVVPAQAGNFDVTFVVANGRVTVDPAPLSVASASASRVYDGTPLAAAEVQVEGLVAGESLPVRATGARTDAGTAANTVQLCWDAGTAQPGDYEVSLAEGTLEVTPAPLTITARAQEYVFNGQNQGEAGSTYEDATQIGTKVQVEGLAAGDALASVTLDGAQTKVGVYEGAIVPSGARVALGHMPDEGSAAAEDALANYEVAYAPGTLTISENAIDLRLSAHDGGGVYNGLPYGLQDAKASLDAATIEYQVNGGAWTTQAPQATDVADSLEGTISVRATLEGYAPTQVDGLSIVVSPRKATVMAQDATKTYGAEDPELQVQVEGLLGQDALEFSVARESGEDVGAYAIQVTGLAEQGNYQVEYVPATFTITPALATVRAQAAAKVYGQDDPELQAQVEGVLDGDSVSFELTRAPGQDVGAYPISAAGAAAQGNYTVRFVGAAFTITPAAAVVTASDAAKVYGAADPAFSATVEGLVNGDTPEAISYGFAREPGEDVGDYAITPEGAAEQGNYTVSFAPGTLAITPAALVVAADDAGKTYGQADPDEFGASVSGLQRGDGPDVVAYTVSREPGENAGAYAITPAGAAEQGNYTVAYQRGTFSISRARAVVAAQDASKVYGEADPQLAATVSGLVEGDSVDFALARAEGHHVGAYAISATGEAVQGNYEVSFTGATFTIQKAPVTVSVADATKTYGDADPAYAVSVDGLKGEDSTALISYTLAREPGEDVGTYAVTLDGADVQGDYEVSYVPAQLTITPAELRVLVDDAAKTYGDADPAFSATVEGLKRGDAPDVAAYTLSRAPGEDAGIYAITATGAATQGNYAVSYQAGELSINKAQATVTALDAAKAYGDADPELGAAVSGLRNGDAAGVLAYAVSRAPGEDAGSYAITVEGEAEQGNYLVEYVPGTFTVVPAGTLAVSGQDMQAVYSGQPVGVPAVPSVVAGTTVEYSTDGGDTWGNAVPTRTDAGTTQVQVRAVNPNYDTATAAYTLEVLPKPVTVKALDGAKVYGDDDPAAFEYAISGLVNGESEDLVQLSSITREAGEDVGAYAITPAGEARQGNYQVEYEPGTFNITARGVTVTGADASKVYGQADPELAATVDGLLDGDSLDFAVTRSAGENVGIYAVMPQGAAEQGNYLVTYVAGHFSITKASATVAAQPASKVYGDDDPAFTATVEGLVEGDSLAYTLARDEGEDVGTYAITPVGEATQDNYEVTYVPADLAITPARVVVAANDKVQVYGGNAAALTATVTGLKRGDAPSVVSYELARAQGRDAGEYAITPTGAAEQGNYLVSYQPGTYAIQPARATVAALDAAKVYGQDDPQLQVAVAGLLFDDTLEFDVVRDPGEDAGDYAITPVGQQRQGNYTVLFVPGTLHIGKARLVLAANDAVQEYGEAPAALTATLQGLAAGDSPDVLSYTLARTPGEDVGSYAITPQVTSNPVNYEVSVAPGTYAITPAPVEVAAVPAGKVYGQPDPDLSATVRGLKGADTAEAIAFSVTRQPGENAGTYAITPAGAAEQGNYRVRYSGADFTVARALATVAADAKAKAYGQPDPELTATVEGLVAGDDASALSFELSREPGEDAGTYAITASGADVQGNYDVAFRGAQLVIARSGNLAVAAADVVATYDGLPHGTQAQPSVAAGTTVEYSTDGGATWQQSAPTRSDAGITQVQVRATNSNYDQATAAYTITVNPKAVTVAAIDAAKDYGQDDPELQAAVTGLVGSGTLEFTLERAPGEDAGSYAITAAGAAEQGNYLVEYLPGAFTIQRAGTLAVLAVDAEFAYDGQPHGPNAAVATVAEGTTVLYRLGDAGAWSRELPRAVDAGAYAVQVLAQNPNYRDAQASCTLTITPAPVAVSALDASKEYGDADPSLTAQVEGLVEGDDESAIRFELSREPGQDAGTYAITATGDAVQGNYAVTFQGAAFTIEQAPVIVAVADAAKTYGDADPAFAATVAGLKAGDTADAIHYGFSRAPGEDVGDYAIAAVGAESQGNYTVSFAPGALSIGRAPVSVAVADAVKAYGDPDPVFTAAVSGLKLGDAETAIRYTLSREPGEDVGIYVIAPVGAAEQGNYEVDFTSGNLEVVPAGTLAVTGTNLDAVYTGQPQGLPAQPSVAAGTTVEYRVNGGAWTTSVPTRTDVGTTHVNVRAMNPNYATATAAYSITVNPAPVAVAANDASKVYGDADPVSFGYSVNGLVEGEAASLIAVDSVTRAAGQDVGGYAITPAGEARQGNYAVTFEPGVFTIAPKGVSVAALPASKAYGQDDPALRARVSGLVAGDAEDAIGYTLTRDAGEDAGTYAINVAGPAVQGNYQVTFQGADFTITRARAVVAADDAAQVYGAPEVPLSATVRGLVAGDTLDVLAFALQRGAGQDAGTYAITPTGAAVQGNYEVAYEPGTYEITRAQATVRALNVAKAYRQADPPLRAAVEGLVAGDAEGIISFAMTREAGEQVGTYAITPVGAAEQGNYDVAFEQGELAIVPSGELAVAGTDTRATYRAAPVSAAPAVASAPGSTVEYRLDDAAAWSAEVPTAVDAGTYTVHARAVNPNYRTAETTYQLVIEPAPVVVRADDAAKTYGDADPAFTAQVAGLLGEDDAAAIRFELARADAGDDAAGDHATIEPAGAAVQGNYAVTFEPGTLHITHARARVVAQPASKVYGQPDPALTAQVEGLVAGDGADAIAFTLQRTAGEDVPAEGALGTQGDAYQVQPAGAAVQGNYRVEYVPATFAIEQRPVTVASASAEGGYDGRALVAHEALVTSEFGFLPGEEPGFVFTGEQTLVGSSANTFGVDAAGSTRLGNYRISLVFGTLTVRAGGDDAVEPGKVVTKAHQDVSYVLGERATWDIAVTNIYDEPKTITLTEQEGMQLAQDVFADVAPGATVRTTATKTVTQADVDAGYLANTVQVRFEGEPGVYVAADEVPVLEQRVDVQKAILNLQERYAVGDDVLYLVTVRNAGAAVLHDVSVEDAMTTGGQARVTSVGDGVVDGSTVTFAELQPGDTRTITLEYTVRPDDAGKRVGNAAVARVPGDPDAGDRAQVESNPVAGVYRLAIHYVFADGTQAAPDFTARLQAGDAFDVPSPAVAGCTPDYARLTSGDAGMPERDLELYVTYRADAAGVPAGADGTPGGVTPTPGGMPPVGPLPAAAGAAAGATGATGVVAVDDAGNPTVEALADEETPLAAAQGSWALLDLLATLAMLLVAVILAVGLLGRKRKDAQEAEEKQADDKGRAVGDAALAVGASTRAAEEGQSDAGARALNDAALAAGVPEQAGAGAETQLGEEPEEGPQTVKRRRALKLIAIALAVAALLLLLFTQDFTQPMAWVDGWTVVFAVLLVVQLALALLSRRKKEDAEEGAREADSPAAGRNGRMSHAGA